MPRAIRAENRFFDFKTTNKFHFVTHYLIISYMIYMDYIRQYVAHMNEIF